METTSHPLTVEDLIDFETGTPQAKALCFLYTNSEYGFKPAEVGEQTVLPRNTASKALSQLWAKDLISKTADGYYIPAHFDHVHETLTTHGSPR